MHLQCLQTLLPFGRCLLGIHFKALIRATLFVYLFIVPFTPMVTKHSCYQRWGIFSKDDSKANCTPLKKKEVTVLISRICRNSPDYFAADFPPHLSLLLTCTRCSLKLLPWIIREPIILLCEEQTICKRQPLSVFVTPGSAWWYWILKKSTMA